MYELASFRLLKVELYLTKIQKIESAKHGGILVNTYTKILSGLNTSLSFTKNGSIKIKLIPVPDEFLVFNDEMFMGLSSNPDYQFLNMHYDLLIKSIGNLIVKKRNDLNLTQKQICPKKYISLTQHSSI